MMGKGKIWLLFLLAFLAIFAYIFKIDIDSNVKKQGFSMVFIKEQNEGLILSSLKEKDKEKKVYEDFKKINPKDYNLKYMEIIDMIRPVAGTITGSTLGSYMLEKVLLSQELTDKNALAVLGRLKILKKRNQDLVEAIKYNLEYIKLAKYMDSDYDVDRGKISLSIIISGLSGYRAANDVLYSILNGDKNYTEERNQVEILTYLNIAENLMGLGKSNETLEVLKKVKVQAQYEPEDYKNNLLILVYSLSSEIYSSFGNEKKAKKYLDLAKINLDRSEKMYFVDEALYYSIARDKYLLNFNINGFTEENITNIMEYTETKSDFRVLYAGYDILFEYYKKIGNFEKYDELKRKYDKRVTSINEVNYEILSLYMIDSIESGIINRENQKLLYMKARLYLYLGILACTIIFSIRKIYKLNRLNVKDGLTKINNRKAFDFNLKRIKSDSYYLLLFDLDNFKNINDTYGHSFGDKVLIHIGELLLKISDKNINSYRVGGEEFAIIFEKKEKDFENVIELCESIRRSIEDSTWEYDMKVTISGGVSYKCEHIYEVCDELLYKAKKSGKNRIIGNF